MDKGDAIFAEQQINQLTAGTVFSQSLAQTRIQLAKMQPIRHQPFVRNDDTYNIAMLPLDGATYQA